MDRQKKYEQIYIARTLAGISERWEPNGLFGTGDAYIPTDSQAAAAIDPRVPYRDDGDYRIYRTEDLRLELLGRHPSEVTGWMLQGLGGNDPRPAPIPMGNGLGQHLHPGFRHQEHTEDSGLGGHFTWDPGRFFAQHLADSPRHRDLGERDTQLRGITPYGWRVSLAIDLQATRSLNAPTGEEIQPAMELGFHYLRAEPCYSHSARLYAPNRDLRTLIAETLTQSRLLLLLIGGNAALAALTAIEGADEDPNETGDMYLRIEFTVYS